MRRSSSESIQLAAGVMLALAGALMIAAPVMFGDVKIRYLADFYDRTVYFERGLWWPQSAAAVSEYPQLATLLFGVLHMIDSWVPSALHKDVYIAVFGSLMLGLLWISFVILKVNIGSRAWLMLLPPAVYFSFNRFDILPSVLCLAALHCVARNRWGWSGLWFALATFAKWYPVLLLPAVMMYAREKTGGWPWRLVLVFGVACLMILAAAYLQGGTEALLAPYQFHLNRGMEFVALPVVVSDWIEQAGLPAIAPNSYFLGFLLLQFSGPLLVLWLRPRTMQDLSLHAIVIIGVFLLFSRIWSPQWFLWLLPFLIWCARSRTDVLLLILYQVATYLCFPLLFDQFGGGASAQLRLGATLTNGLLALIIVRSFWLAKQFKRPGNSQTRQ